MTGNVISLATIWVVPVIIAIVFYEAAHGFVAHLLGDDTAWRLGRVTFNPLKHIDPVGTILLPGMRAPPGAGMHAAAAAGHRDLHPAQDCLADSGPRSGPTP